MKAAVILFPGVNRERDVARALTQAGAEVEILWHEEDKLPPGTDLAVLPGGFSYGDYLRCGAIAARARAMDAVREHAARGGLVLGICNGFQILCEAGLLPGALMRNAGLKFICRMQTLRVENAATRFGRGYKAGDVVTFAIAHGEGAYIAAPDEIAMLESSGRVAFRYCDAHGGVTAAANPNGSLNNIAGVYNAGFNVLGLMPHPENLIDPLTGGVDGRPLFAGLQLA
ncbi:MAG: phosphoribosylformylglycinamidine synthase subunit PurQ [Pseudomonadota bacterium]|nr:phosphoribosylformylglycinamidine synthase subunit PurQ [Pseudomonadota bacterium]